MSVDCACSRLLAAVGRLQLTRRELYLNLGVLAAVLLVALAALAGGGGGGGVAAAAARGQAAPGSCPGGPPRGRAGALRDSPKRCSHSDAPLYVSLVIIHTEYTGVRQNDCNV